MSQQPAPKMPEPEFLELMTKMFGGKKQPQKESA